jgi:hypothetical protein
VSERATLRLGEPIPTQRVLEQVMPYYRFAISNEIDSLGVTLMADDDAALALGKQLTRELMQEYAEHYSGSTMDITEGDRTVGSIPFNFDVGQG